MSYNPGAELALATERDFERAVLPFLNILWPTLSQPPQRGYWDRRGVDLMTDPTEQPIACCVQCKGFAVATLGPDQYAQIFDSLSRFASSAILCNRYIIIHNRDSRARDSEGALACRLSQLVERRVVSSAEVWDRQRILKEVDSFVTHQLTQTITSLSEERLYQIEQLYGTGWAWQLRVPIGVERLAFSRDLPARILSKSPHRVRSVNTALFSKANTRWTMVTGRYGLGKTSATLLASHYTNRNVIYAECARFDPSPLGGGMNSLTKEITRALDIRAPLESCQKQYEYFAGRSLSRMLRDESSNLILVLDGLDENSHYTRLRGLAQLTSQLAEVRCPIVLVTRREHFDECFGDMSSAFFDLSLKNGPAREALVLDLGLWTKAEVLSVLRRSAKHRKEHEKKVLKELSALVEKGQIQEYYGTLPFHPLFLRFIVDDALNEGLRPSGRAELIGRWVARKIGRDRGVQRIAPSDDMDLTKFVDHMLFVMEEASGCMTVQTEGSINLTEAITEKKLNTIAEGAFRKQGELVLGILLNSVLVSVRPRSIGRPFLVAFPHRVLQEYFLARGLMRRGRPVAPYPRAVRAFCEELSELC